MADSFSHGYVCINTYFWDCVCACARVYVHLRKCNLETTYGHADTQPAYIRMITWLYWKFNFVLTMYLWVVKRAAANISNVICLWQLWFSKTAFITSITRFEKYNNIVLLCLKALRKWYLISLSITGQVTLPCVLFVFFLVILLYFSNLVMLVVIVVFENHNCPRHITFERFAAARFTTHKVDQ